MLASRNAFTASTGLGGAQLPNVYVDPATGHVISSKATSYAVRIGGVTYNRGRQDTGIALNVQTADDTQIVWAHISDYGFGYPQRVDISNLVHSFNPDFIVAAGDNWQSGATNTLAELDSQTGAYLPRLHLPVHWCLRCGGSRARLHRRSRQPRLDSSGHRAD